MNLGAGGICRNCDTGQGFFALEDGHLADVGARLRVNVPTGVDGITIRIGGGAGIQTDRLPGHGPTANDSVTCVALNGCYRMMIRLPVTKLGDNLSISPSSIDLSKGETQFIAEAGREYILRDCLEKTDLGGNATVILDCPPSLGVLSIGCLTAAKYTCVVVQPGGFELRTLAHLDETVRMLRERVNPGLSVLGAVLTNCHHRRLITEEVCREVSKYWPVLGQVRADARLLYATTSGKVHYLTRSNALNDYAAVAERLQEILPWLRNQSAA